MSNDSIEETNYNVEVEGSYNLELYDDEHSTDEDRYIAIGVAEEVLL